MNNEPFHYYCGVCFPENTNRRSLCDVDISNDLIPFDYANVECCTACVKVNDCARHESSHVSLAL